MTRLHLLLAFACSTTLSAQQWVQRANMSQPLLDATGFSIGPDGYVFGGFNGSSTQPFIWRYSSELNTWGAPVPFPGTIVRGCAAAGVAGMGYVYGGRTGPNGQYSSALWAFDPGALEWSQRASKPGVGLAYPSAFALNGRFYVFGGSTPSDTYTNELWEYRPDVDLWTMKATLPAAGRSGAIAVAVNGKGYIIGGNDASANFASRDVWEYDPALNSWTQKADMPGPERRVGCGFELGGLAYAGGGWDGTTRFTDFYTYEPATNVWSAIPDYGGAGAYSSVAFSTDNAGYVAVGGTSAGASAQCWAFVEGSIGVTELASDRFRPYRSGSEIVVEGWDNSTTGSYTITDISGRIAAQGAMRNSRVDVARLPSASYVLHLRDAQGASFAWKFVLEQ